MDGRLQDTTVSNVSDLWSQRVTVAALLPHMTWRRHGIGALQGYVHENPERELRVHIWSPALMLPGILESGNAHNHRFAMRSRVLLGELQHTEWQVGHGSGFELYDFVHARLHTDENRAEMRRLPREVSVRKVAARFVAGDEYVFERSAYHDSLPLSRLVVTLVEKFDQRDERARVIAPAGTNPVPAFGGGDPDPLLVQELVHDARCHLLESP